MSDLDHCDIICQDYMSDFSFHNNRFQISKILGFFGMIIIGYYYTNTPLHFMFNDVIRVKKDTTQDSSELRYDINIKDFNNVAKKVSFNEYKNGMPIIIYEALSKDFSNKDYGIVSFCGTANDLVFKEGSLRDLFMANIPDLNIYLDSKNNITTKHGENVNILPILFEEIRTSYEGNVIYACKNNEKLDRKNFNNYSDVSNVFCQKIGINKSYSGFNLKYYNLDFLKEGKGSKVSCLDKVSFNYAIFLDKTDIVISKGKIADVTIGVGSIPIQIEKALLHSRKGSVFLLRINGQDLKNITFYSDIDMPIIYKELLSSSLPAKPLLFKISVI